LNKKIIQNYESINTEKLIVHLKKQKKKMQNVKYAKKILIGAGIITEKGNLKKPYRNLKGFFKENVLKAKI